MQPNPGSTSVAQASARTCNAHVLLAEDDPPSRLFLSEALRGLGCTVRACTTGAEALDAARAHRFDLLLLDRNLPPPDGESILRALRADSSAASQHACAVACSADHGRQSARAARAAGFDAVLEKPCSIEQLRHALQRYCAPGMEPLVDDARALAAAGSDGNVTALRRLLVRELEEIESNFGIESQDTEICAEALHRLVASAGFCGAPALGTAAATLRQQILAEQDHSAAQAQFQMVLSATLEHFQTTS